MASIQSEIRTFLESWSAAIRAKDIEALMPNYSPDIVYFDVVPPLRLKGAPAVRRNFLRWFDGWKSAIGVEIRELNIMAGENVAAAFMLHRTSGTLQDGREVAYWVRATVSLERSNQSWLITHEHVSLPVDFKNGTAVMDLAP